MVDRNRLLNDKDSMFFDLENQVIIFSDNDFKLFLSSKGLSVRCRCLPRAILNRKYLFLLCNGKNLKTIASTDFAFSMSLDEHYWFQLSEWF